MRRLLLSPSHKRKISRALTGHEVSAETREKQSAAQKGKPKSPEARAAIAAARRARPTGNEAVIAAGRAEAKKRHDKDCNDRLNQMRLDVVQAHRMGRRDLMRDVIQSAGWRHARKIFDPTKKVSDGKDSPGAGRANARNLQKSGGYSGGP